MTSEVLVGSLSTISGISGSEFLFNYWASSCSSSAVIGSGQLFEPNQPRCYPTPSGMRSDKPLIPGFSSVS